MLSDEQRKQVKAMVAAMRAEGAKFPARYVSPMKSTKYGDGPMSTTIARMTPFGACGCLNYWSRNLFIQEMNQIGILDAYCSVDGWPTPWRRRYQSVKTVRAQYRVMADFVEAEVLK